MTRETAQEWSIGELADLVGVSVRTLRHYESVDLLEPRERSDGGHRRYGEEEVYRLRRILALRELGFGLQTIGRLLDSDNRETLLETTRQQLRRVEVDLDVAAGLQMRLRRLLRQLERTVTGASVTELLDEPREEDMAIRLDEIYTGFGDGGETQLGNLERVSKLDPRIDAGGDLDELGAGLGLVLASNEVPQPDRDWLRRVGNDLMDVGYDLAIPTGSNDSSPRTNPTYTAWLERVIEEGNKDLEPLESFVVSFGTARLAGQLDALRAVCRRAERRIIVIEDVNPEIIRYLNRLSDLFFVLARRAAAGGEDLWRPGRGAEIAD